jgi:hypothetical protein
MKKKHLILLANTLSVVRKKKSKREPLVETLVETLVEKTSKSKKQRRLSWEVGDGGGGKPSILAFRISLNLLRPFSLLTWFFFVSLQCSTFKSSEPS